MEIMRTQTVKFLVEEQNGLFDFGSIICDVDKDPKSEYLAMRYMQSIKGFKKPMPKSVEIESTYIN